MNREEHESALLWEKKQQKKQCERLDNFVNTKYINLLSDTSFYIANWSNPVGSGGSIHLHLPLLVHLSFSILMHSQPNSPGVTQRAEPLTWEKPTKTHKVKARPLYAALGRINAGYWQCYLKRMYRRQTEIILLVVSSLSVCVSVYAFVHKSNWSEGGLRGRKGMMKRSANIGMCR